MATRGEFLTHTETMTEIGEMTRIEHFREIIGLIKGGLIVISAMMWAGGNDNGGYFDADRDNSDYQWGHSQSQVGFAENGNNDFPIVVKFDDIVGRHTDSDVEAYLANNRVAGEYSDAERAEACDVCETFAKTKLARNVTGGASGRRSDSERSYVNAIISAKGPERNDFVRTAVEMLRMKDRLELRTRRTFAWRAITSNERLACRRWGGGARMF